jgi:hypothetical protein
MTGLRLSANNDRGTLKVDFGSAGDAQFGRGKLLLSRGLRGAGLLRLGGNLALPRGMSILCASVQKTSSYSAQHFTFRLKNVTSAHFPQFSTISDVKMWAPELHAKRGPE